MGYFFFLFNNAKWAFADIAWKDSCTFSAGQLKKYEYFLVGLGLLLGCLTTAAMFFGLLMNFSYLFAGTISSSPLDILLGVIILFAGANAGRVGFDRWMLPFIRKTIFKRKGKDNNRTVKGNQPVIGNEHENAV